MDVGPCDTCETARDEYIRAMIIAHGGQWICPACMTTYRTTHLVE